MTNTEERHALGDLLPSIVELSRQAGRAIMTVYSEVDTAVEYKRDNSPLTQADLASHKIIVEALTALTPDWPVLSEESNEIPYNERSLWGYFWLVDPLDGTKEFLRRNGEFTVNIALMHNGAPILGVVYAPALDKMYFAAQGLGAFKEIGGVATPIKVAKVENGTVQIVASRSHRSQDENFDQFALGFEKYELVPMGSSLKFCLVAEGVAHVYPRTGPTMEWDTAAAHCIVEEAGGRVTDLEGSPLKYNKPVLLNPGFLAKTTL